MLPTLPRYWPLWPGDAISGDEDADAHKTDYVAGLSGATLRGMRLGILPQSKTRNAADVAFAKTVATIKGGRPMVEIENFAPPPSIG